MSGYIVTPEATADLFQIWQYIARDSEVKKVLKKRDV
jgi:plasmid stabilization system protein ParE